MKVWKKLVPEPYLSLGLLVSWLALVRSASPGHVLLGLALAIILPPMTASLRPTRIHTRRPLLFARYVLTVGRDVVVSNVVVASGVVVGPWRPPRSRFVAIPLDLQDSLGLSVLAMVVTVVPGTVWSELAIDRSALMLHVWDVEDEARFVARFKARYEAPLREIFE